MVDLTVQSLTVEATNIRREFLLRTIDNAILKRLYFQYNPNVEIDSFIEGALRFFPALNCGLASVYIRNRLNLGSIVVGKYCDHLHTFLIVPIDGKNNLVDITSDQYGGPAVYVGPIKSPWYLEL